MAKWTNLKFKTWLKEIEPASLSQEKLKNEAVKFSKEFVEVDKKTIAKVVDDFEKEHKKVVADVSHSVFEKWVVKTGKQEEGGMCHQRTIFLETKTCSRSSKMKPTFKRNA